MESTTDDLRGLYLNADDNEDEDDEEEQDQAVFLAFVREPDGPEELQRHRFPSKAGGAPAWLDPVHLPTGDSRLCGFCGDPLRLALQVSAPLPPPPPPAEGEHAAYHRALFVFMCPAMACLRLDQREQQRAAIAAADAGACRRRRSVRVFRCQLPRDNAFYSNDADGGDDDEATCAAGVEPAPLCAWCGTWGAETACAAAGSFCSDKHLERHLRSGHCNGGGGGDDAPASASVWPEYAMYAEEEPDDDDDDDDESTSTTAAQEHGHDADQGEAVVDDAWMDAVKAAGEDKACWASFLARVSPRPAQVLRYCDGGAGVRPLWAAASGSLPAGAAPPPCPRCGAPRWYEMQLMPQLLHYLRVEARDPDPLDWATVVVYTCAWSCGGAGGGGYVEEFAWVQLEPTTTAGTSATATMAPK